MRILFASSEVYPLIKTGGLADVSGQLPVALRQQGLDIRIILPGYRKVMQKLEIFTVKLTESVAEYDFRLLESQLPSNGITVWIIDCPALFDRPGGPYQDEQGNDWPDNGERFALFCKVIALIAQHSWSLDWVPDLVHCNDWQTGLVPALLDHAAKQRCATLFTIHNLAYQGIYPRTIFDKLNLPEKYWSSAALEFHNQLSFIKGGLVFADHINTVSPNYAKEIRTAEFGCGLEGVLQQRQTNLSGILNGIDTMEWDPAQDSHITQHYTANSLFKKVRNKLALQAGCQLPINVSALLLGVVSRLTWQKGIDLILATLPQLVDLPIQWFILGTGDPKLEQQIKKFSEQYPKNLVAKFAYNESLAHQIIAGSDVFMMPSRFEPCGLTQLYSLRYGTLPLVNPVGGLADTVVASNPATIASKQATGFALTDLTIDALADTVKYILKCYQDKLLWQQLQLTAMQQDFSWTQSANQYIQLYQKICR